MANIVDKTFFVNELDIPNTNKADVEARLNLFIAKYQKAFMMDVFGADIYAEYMDGATDFMSQPWKGLKELIVDSTAKTSAIANIVYYWWQRNETTQSTPIGEGKTKGENMERISNSPKAVRAWNEMAMGLKPLFNYLCTNFEYNIKWCTINDKYGVINEFSI